jgi:hypothetical protein
LFSRNTDDLQQNNTLRAPSCTAETDFVPYMAFYVWYNLSCSSDFCTLYLCTLKAKICQKTQKFQQTASSAASAVFATSTAYLASLVCLVVFKKQQGQKQGIVEQKSDLDDSVDDRVHL